MIEGERPTTEPASDRREISPFVNAPDFLLEQVFKEIAGENNANPSHRLDLVREFRDLALVHRSWTVPSQKALAQVATASFHLPRDFYKVLSLAVPPTWFRDISIVQSFDLDDNWLFFAYSVNFGVDQTYRILRSFTGVRRLQYRFTGFSNEFVNHTIAASRRTS
jgi:hypothetical protein